ncbi:lysin A [Microbacterium phage Rasputia]|nr:lysin A [Microbacterium phage Rasputia]
MAFTYQGARVDLGFGRGWLDKGPAASIGRIDRALGHPLQITEAGRDWAQQNKHFQHYLKYGYPIALNPNTPSEHQKGKSIDSDEAQKHQALMEEHGWRRTVYRWVNGVWTLVERWHYEYFPHLDLHINDKIIPTSKENTMPVSVRTPNGKIYAIDTGSIIHYSRPSQATVTTDVNDPGPGTGETHNLTLTQFVDYLDGMLIPRTVLDKDGNVLNPETGKFEVGGAWSWERVNKAANDRIEKQNAELAKSIAAQKAQADRVEAQNKAIQSQLAQLAAAQK